MTSFVQKYLRQICFYGGLFITLVWTLLRHLNNGINFDIVGQIGLADQWAAGLTQGSLIGTTNYLVKIPLYLLLNSLHFISAMNVILIAAVVANVLTFVAIYYIYLRFLKLLKVKDPSWAYIAVLWLAILAGGIFWMDYANSRNVETIGGLVFLYLASVLIIRPGSTSNHKYFLLLIFAGGIAFFADPLQFFVCGVGVIIFAILNRFVMFTKQLHISRTLIIGTVSAYLLSLLIRELTTKFLPVNFLHIPSKHFSINLGNILHSLQIVVISTLKIFDANIFKQPLGFSSILLFINFIVLIATVYILVKVWPKIRGNPVYVLLITVIATNYVIYLASGQVTEWETSRYLIMVPIITLLLVSLNGDNFNSSNLTKIKNAWIILAVISSVLVIGGLVVAWPNKHSKDQKIYSTIHYLESHGYKYSLGSREQGITDTYFSSGRAQVLPMSCQPDHTLAPSNLFYDSAVYGNVLNSGREIPILLQNHQIVFGNLVCTQEQIIRQFGYPLRQETIPGVGTALIYKNTTIDAKINHRPRMLNSVIQGNTADKQPVTITNNFVPLPSDLQKLERCTNGTIDVIVAHPDDDILFMNPDLSNNIGYKCIRVVYITAADDGRDEDYWRNRERGIQAAYSEMLGAKNIWTNTTPVIGNHILNQKQLIGYPSLSLIFLRLADGNVNGSGFESNQYSSLQNLANNKQESILSVDASAEYTRQGLVDVLATIVSGDQPNTVYTLASAAQLSIGDHSDHHEAGKIALEATKNAAINTVISSYIGYPINYLPQNIDKSAVTQKRKIFATYAHEDETICSDKCSIANTYENYFSRIYKTDQILLIQNPTQIGIAINKQPPAKPVQTRTITNLILGRDLRHIQFEQADYSRIR